MAKRLKASVLIIGSLPFFHPRRVVDFLHHYHRIPRQSWLNATFSSDINGHDRTPADSFFSLSLGNGREIKSEYKSEGEKKV